eukprot:m.61396 g.61396  ORF g.61396 m.61396 type:complete len:309 (+) comp11861_c0_seq1:95-1021(+)
MEGAPLLSDYEWQRKPQPVTEGTITLPWNALTDQFKCPICLNLISNTRVTTCMHRFCSDCIAKAHRLDKRKCPTCRADIPSLRSIKKDKRFDALIDKLYPDRTILERHQQELMKRLHDHSNLKAVVESVKDGMKDQAQHRFKKAKSTPSRSASSGSAAATSVPASSASASASHGLKLSTSTKAVVDGVTITRPRGMRGKLTHIPGLPLLEMILKPSTAIDPKHRLPLVSKPYVNAPQDSMFKHIAAFICHDLNSANPDLNLVPQQIDLYVQFANGAQLQNPRKAIRTLAYFFSAEEPNTPLVLYYNLA